MDKLQELLKEYQLSKGEWVRLAGPDVEVNDKEELVLEATLISKKYGFIKWLVENDKIDYEKIGRFKAERKNTQIISIANKSDFYLSLLMLLSISDTPIEDLVSYLI